MPRKIARLSDVKIRSAKPKEKDFKLFDGEGLFLLIKPSGSKLWRFKYRFNGKEKLLAIGKYPDIELSSARKKRDDARTLVAEGIDPGQEKKAAKEARLESETNTFELIAREWFERFKDQWVETHSVTVISRLERDVFPEIGQRPILEITPPEMLRVLRKVEIRGALETARRIRQICSAVFRYAVACGKADRDPMSDLKGAIPPPRRKHFAAVTDPKELSALLRAIDGYEGSVITRCALQLAPLVFVRPGELRKAEWEEFDLEESLWTIPAEKMKMRRPHIVPLSKQTLEILAELRPLTSLGKYLFPSMRSRSYPISNNTLNAALRRMGFSTEEMTAHGFRSSASTLLHEMGWNSDVIERQLAHVEQNKIKGAYNRAQYLPERKKMMQAWADYLEALRQGAKVIPFRGGMAVT